MEAKPSPHTEGWEGNRALAKTPSLPPPPRPNSDCPTSSCPAVTATHGHSPYREGSGEHRIANASCLVLGGMLGLRRRPGKSGRVRAPRGQTDRPPLSLRVQGPRVVGDVSFTRGAPSECKHLTPVWEQTACSPRWLPSCANDELAFSRKGDTAER